jgi:galactose oxidase
MTLSSALATSTIDRNNGSCFPGFLKSCLAILLMLAASFVIAQDLTGPGTVGKWQILTNKVPINPVHAAVMHNGKVLMIEGKNTVPPLAAIWDPATQVATTFAITYTMFCDAMVVLPDGRPFVMGGTLQFTPAFTGQPLTAAYDLTTGVFTNQASMADGRWYPTGTVLDDGRVMVFSGQDDGNGDTNKAVEFFTANSGIGSWSQEFIANWTPPLYPRMHLLPDGDVFYSGSGTLSKFFNPATQVWSDGPTTILPTARVYGSSVLLPLSPANGYDPKVMILGGGKFDTTTAATDTTEIVDLSFIISIPPRWTQGPAMTQPRIQLNATILPSGNVLVTGGSKFNEDPTTASLNADLYHSNPTDPKFNTFTSAGMNAIPRLYHSNAILLPDATVLLTGSNPPKVPFENRLELYQPAYLFKLDGTLAVRPVITSVPAGPIAYNTAFQVNTPDAGMITSVVLIRPAGVTHAFNMEQRLVELTFTTDAGGLKVTSPRDGKIAPPGYYMVFILNSSGVPSVSKFIQLCNGPCL